MAIFGIVRYVRYGAYGIIVEAKTALKARLMVEKLSDRKVEMLCFDFKTDLQDAVLPIKETGKDHIIWVAGHRE